MISIAAITLLGVPGGAFAAAGADDTPGIVNGVLQDPAGRRIAGATINVRDATGALVASARTDDEGNFTFEADPGAYTLQLVSAGGRSIVSGGTVVVVEGTTAVIVVASHDALAGIPRQGGGLFGKGKGFTIAALAIAGAGGSMIARVASKEHASPSR